MCRSGREMGRRFILRRIAREDTNCGSRTSRVPVQLKSHSTAVLSGVESYDGRYLYYVKYFCSGIWRMPIDGGEEEQIMNLPEPWYLGYWDISESGVYFYDIAATPRPAIKYYDFKTRQTTTVLEPEGAGQDMVIWNQRFARRAHSPLRCASIATSTLMVADEIH